VEKLSAHLDSAAILSNLERILRVI